MADSMIYSLNSTPPGGAVRSVSLILPMFNERDVMVPLFKRMIPVLWRLHRRWRVQLVLVDDGSEDGTCDLLRRHFRDLPWAQCTILCHEKNGGLGAAMATGFAAATGDVVCTMDADCTYSPEKIEAMIDHLEESGADIVTASPYHPLARSASAKAGRLFLSKAASWIYMALAPTRLYCYTSFFRVYRRRWADPGLFKARDFLAVTELLVNAAYAGAAIREYPLRLGLRVYGRSKMHLLCTIRNHLRLMSHMAALRLQVRKPLNAPM